VFFYLAMELPTFKIPVHIHVIKHIKALVTNIIPLSILMNHTHNVQLNIIPLTGLSGILGMSKDTLKAEKWRYTCTCSKFKMANSHLFCFYVHFRTRWANCYYLFEFQNLEMFEAPSIGVSVFSLLVILTKYLNWFKICIVVILFMGENPEIKIYLLLNL